MNNCFVFLKISFSRIPTFINFKVNQYLALFFLNTFSFKYSCPSKKKKFKTLITINHYALCYLELIANVKVKVAQSCPILCDPMDYTVPGILQSRIPEWVAFPFSRGSSQPRDRAQVSSIAGKYFTSSATR